MADQGWWSDVAAGIEHALAQGARVISTSIGGEHDATLQRACDDAYASGVLVFASAGNWGNDWRNYPVSFTSVIGVGALDEGCTEVAYFSSRGFGDHLQEGKVELAAPGSYIYSTHRDGLYKYWSGTSFSCPLAAGIGAGYVALSAWNNQRIRAHMQLSADGIGDPFDCGYGRVDAFAFGD